MNTEKISPIARDKRFSSKMRVVSVLCVAVATAGGLVLTKTATARPTHPAPCVTRDLATLGGLFGIATGANSRGDVVGTADDVVGVSHPVLWRNGVPERLDVAVTAALPVDVNSRGDVLGLGRTADGPVGWLFSHGRTVLLRTSGDGIAEPTAINDMGLIAGALTENQNEEEHEVAGGQGEDERAALWRSPDALPQVLPPLPGDQGGRALSVDGLGRVGGVSEGAKFTPVIWDAQGVPRAMPTLGGGYGAVRGFGADGTAIGDSVTSDGSDHPVMWRPDGQIVDLGLPEGATSAQASGFLQNGFIIGTAQTTGSHGGMVSQAVRWTSAGKPEPLSASGGGESDALVSAAVDATTLVGHGLDADGGRHPLIWQCGK
jgi:uncharacterized membrane protein